MANVKILKGVSAPPPRTVYPWDRINVGDGFEWTGPLRNSYGAAVRASRRLAPKRFRASTRRGVTIVYREK